MTATSEGRRARSSACDMVSNGRLLPKSVDLRSAAGRRFRHLVQSFTEELGGDLSELDRNLIRQAAAHLEKASSCRRHAMTAQDDSRKPIRNLRSVRMS